MPWRATKGLIATGIMLACGCGRARSEEVAASPPREPSLRLMTYNVWVFNENLDALVEQISAADADIVCLQETTPRSQPFLRDALQDRYPYNRAHLSRINNGPAVFSKLPLVESSYMRSTQGINGYWKGQVDWEGRRLQIINVHLHPTNPTSRNPWRVYQHHGRSSATRVQELEEIAAWIDQELPTVVLGDFNAFPDGAAYEHALGQGFVDGYRKLHGQHDPTFRLRALGLETRLTLDYVFHDARLETVAAQVVHAGPSDHYPLVADIAWAAPG